MMKVSCMFALATLATFAGAAMAAPKPVKVNAVKVEPIRLRTVKLVEGKVVPTSAWRPYVAGNAYQKDAIEYAFDAVETLSGNTPGGDPTGGRYTLGDAGIPYNSPVVLNDMTVAPGFSGAQSQQVDFGWAIGADATDMNISVFTFEDELNDTCAVPGGGYDGIQLGFGFLAANVGDYYYSNVDVSTDPTLFWQMPMDGAGTVAIFLDSDAFLTPANGQMALWFTGEDMVPPQARRGTQQIKYAADDQTTPTTCVTIQALTAAQNIPDTFVDLSCECHDLGGFGTPEGDPLSCLIGFGAEASGCYPDCDGTGVLDIDDFICFQTFFAIGDPYADCDASGVLDIDDFICFSTFFAIGC